MKRLDRAVEPITLALLCASAILSALLEVAFLAEFYAGKMIIPVVILAALAGNILLPVWGFRTVHQISGALLPVVCWLVPILVLTMYTRPEGDLFVLGEFYQDVAFYGLLLIGAAAGFGTIVLLAGRFSR